MIDSYCSATLTNASFTFPKRNNDTLAFYGFMDFIHAHELEIVSSERSIYSEQWKFAGTFDAIVCDKQKRPMLLDWKVALHFTPYTLHFTPLHR